MKTFALCVAVAAAALVPASAIAKSPSGSSASVPFVHFGGIQDWQADDENTLYVESQGGQWFRAEMAGPCFNLPNALGLRIDTGGTDTFDAFSTVIVGHERCQVMNVTQVSGPPGSHRKAKANPS